MPRVPPEMFGAPGGARGPLYILLTATNRFLVPGSPQKPLNCDAMGRGVQDPDSRSRIRPDSEKITGSGFGSGVTFFTFKPDLDWISESKAHQLLESH